jgi:hypothetical protein
MRRGALTITLLVGRAAISWTPSVYTETRHVVGGKAFEHGVPIEWVSDGALVTGSPDGRARDRLRILSPFRR